MTRDEILKLSRCHLAAAIALKLGLELYSRGNQGAGSPIYVVIERGNEEIQPGWQKAESVQDLPEQFYITGESYLVRRLYGTYIHGRLTTEEERERYIDALMDLCQVNAHMVYHDGVGWADYPGLWRLIDTAPEDHMRAFLIAKGG